MNRLTNSENLENRQPSFTRLYSVSLYGDSYPQPTKMLPVSREVWQISLPAYLAPTPPYFPGSGKYFNQNMSPLRRTLQGVVTNMQ